MAYFLKTIFLFSIDEMSTFTQQTSQNEIEAYECESEIIASEMLINQPAKGGSDRCSQSSEEGQVWSLKNFCPFYSLNIIRTLLSLAI